MKLPVRPVRLCVVLTALALMSCAQPVRVVAPRSKPYSVTSPQNVVKTFEWAVNNRSADVLAELFTEDFLFIGAGTDSAGNPSRNAMDRAWLLARFRCLFEGGGTEGPPRAQSIQFDFDRNLVPVRDPRPGYRDQDSLYKTIRTSVALTLRLGDGSTIDLTGYALFFLSRGDVAMIPADLAVPGLSPDKSRWWITRWEDETLSAGGSPGATDPARRITVGELLGIYDCPPQFRPVP